MIKIDWTAKITTLLSTNPCFLLPPMFQSTMGIPATSSHKHCIFILFIALTNFLCSPLLGAQQPCNQTGSAGSTYVSNLNSLLSYLYSNIGNSGFLNSSFGDDPDRARATALCRADFQLADCRRCIYNAAVILLHSCPINKQAAQWEDSCTLRYSNDDSIFGIPAVWPRVIVRSLANVSSVEQFNADLRPLMDDLSRQAADGGSLMKVAAGNRAGPDFLTIYGMEQCAPDLSADDCSQCLATVAQTIPDCCNGVTGLRIMAPSCTLWYETSGPFVNLSRIREVQALVAPAPASPPGSPVILPPGNGGDSDTTRTIIIIVVSVSTFIVLVTCATLIYRKKLIKRMPKETTENDVEMNNEDSIQYEFDKIKAATNDFSEANKLGHGGFGTVYKGKLEHGEEIAVKRLSKGSSQGNLEFKTEVLLMAKLQHRNLVRLYGFAIQGTERLLIYEFVQNSSLDNFIFDPIKRYYIDWDRRYKIIWGIARGLLYLHEDSRFRIIHRDLKASNILLDSNMNPKIADFGTARLFQFDESEGNTSKIVGTYGYMAPEYVLHGQLSLKIDVFSFGVLVLEIVSGQKNNSFRTMEGVDNMLSFVWRNWQEGTLENVIDPMLRSGSGLLRDMIRYIHIGLLCVQENPIDRPTMASVILMLNSSSVTMAVPSQPPFVMSNRSDLNLRDAESNKSTEEGHIRPICPASNEASMTEPYPR